jgi:hypothetical protein
MRLISLIAVLAFCSCATEEVPTDHDETSDFDVTPDDGKADGLPPSFNANTVVDDALLTASGAMTVTDVQAFFERSPYGNRSWLASETVDGVSAAQIVVDAAVAEGINPLVLIARMQVETSLVSKTSRPTQRMIDRALGCGCPDGGSCSGTYRGFVGQLQCGARIMRRWYDASVDGSGAWRKGHTKRTLDPQSVTPSNHATASLYAYTPWVLVGRGGTWLAWNVTRKFLRHAQQDGLIQP